MKAFLDACVIFPSVVREMLIGAAKSGLYTPCWSPRVLEEWARAARRHGVEGEARVEIALLTDRFPAASVAPIARDMGRLHLPDPDDIHVLASAIAASADVLITLNAKDFPRHTLNEEGLFRQDPDGFLHGLFSEDPAALTAVADEVFARSQTMGQGPETPAALLKKARLSRLAKALRTT